MLVPCPDLLGSSPQYSFNKLEVLTCSWSHLRSTICQTLTDVTESFKPHAHSSGVVAGWPAFDESCTHRRHAVCTGRASFRARRGSSRRALSQIMRVCTVLAAKAVFNNVLISLLSKARDINKFLISAYLFGQSFSDFSTPQWHTCTPDTRLL